MRWTEFLRKGDVSSSVDFFAKIRWFREGPVRLVRIKYIGLDGLCPANVQKAEAVWCGD